MLTEMVWVGAAFVTAAVVRWGRIGSIMWDDADFIAVLVMVLAPSALATLATVHLNGAVVAQC